jgi:RNA polymerase sigma-70 factor (ECF subfamily)
LPLCTPGWAGRVAASSRNLGPGAGSINPEMEDERLHELVRQRFYAEAFEGLLDRYQNKVYRLAFSFTRDRSRAEELTQDAFLKIWRALPRFDGRASLSTWLYSVARNTCLSALRYDARRRMQALDETHQPAARTLEGGARPNASGVWGLVDRLPEAQRRVITLFYVEDRSVCEVGRLLDMPEGTVKSHLHRARRALADAMKAKGAR